MSIWSGVLVRGQRYELCATSRKLFGRKWLGKPYLLIFIKSFDLRQSFIFRIFASMKTSDNAQTNYFMPAEWYPQSGIQLVWPHEQMDWEPYLEEIRQTYLRLIEVITRFEPVVIGTKDEEATRQYLSTRLADECMRNIKVMKCEHDDTWARDFGMITLLSPEGNAMLLDFQFNGWGGKFEASKDNLSSWYYFRKGLFKGIHADYNYFVLEGGSVESDGKGTVFTTSSCLMAPHRNQPLKQEEIEEQLRQRLHAKRIIWLNHGQLIGDDTDGHIDTIVRTAPDDTLVYVKCENKADLQYEDFQRLEEELRQLVTLEGKPYRLIPVPMPDAIIYDGERLPATYANFLVINGAVIVPTYAQPTNDTKAMENIQQAFPDREIVGVDARVIIRQHGSIHCLTMQYPKGVLQL